MKIILLQIHMDLFYTKDNIPPKKGYHKMLKSIDGSVNIETRNNINYYVIDLKGETISLTENIFYAYCIFKNGTIETFNIYDFNNVPMMCYNCIFENVSINENFSSFDRRYIYNKNISGVLHLFGYNELNNVNFCATDNDGIFVYYSTELHISDSSFNTFGPAIIQYPYDNGSKIYIKNSYFKSSGYSPIIELCSNYTSSTLNIIDSSFISSNCNMSQIEVSKTNIDISGCTFKYPNLSTDFYLNNGEYQGFSPNNILNDSSKGLGNNMQLGLTIGYPIALTPKSNDNYVDKHGYGGCGYFISSGVDSSINSNFTEVNTFENFEEIKVAIYNKNTNQFDKLC